MRLRWACQNAGEGRGNVEDTQQVGSSFHSVPSTGGTEVRRGCSVYVIRSRGEATSLFSPNVQIVISFNFPWDVPG